MAKAIPLYTCSKEIVMDLLETPEYQVCHTSSLLNCSFASTISRQQPHMIILDSVGCSFKFPCYNHKHEIKENNYSTCTRYQVFLITHSFPFISCCYIPVGWKRNNPPSLQSPCRSFMLEKFRTLSVELFFRGWQANWIASNRLISLYLGERVSL